MLLGSYSPVFSSFPGYYNAVLLSYAMDTTLHRSKACSSPLPASALDIKGEADAYEAFVHRIAQHAEGRVVTLPLARAYPSARSTQSCGAISDRALGEAARFALALRAGLERVRNLCWWPSTTGHCAPRAVPGAAPHHECTAEHAEVRGVSIDL